MSSIIGRRPSRTGSLASNPSFSLRKGNSRTPLSDPSINKLSLNDHDGDQLADELDFVTISAPPAEVDPQQYDQQLVAARGDKASRVLGVKHRTSMEPIPASRRTSLVSTHSAREPPPSAPSTSPLTSLYVVSGLPKSPHTWTLADPDSVLGLHHSEGAVNRWWRPEVLGSTVSPGAGGGKKKRRGKSDENLKGAGALSKQEVGKMLSKALKLSFTREVEVIASTLQPASTVHTFTFTLPAPNTPLAPSASGDLLRASILSGDNRSTAGTFNYAYGGDDPFVRPSSAYLGPPSLLGHGASSSSAAPTDSPIGSTITYYGVCLTVWSHADTERSTAIRRTLEAGRSRKESAQSVVASRLKNLRADAGTLGAGSSSDHDPTLQARRNAKRSSRGPWGDGDTDAETDNDGAVSESDFEVASTVGHTPGESTLFLPGDTVFWLPYALTLVSRHPVYDLMRDYLTLSWARFSKDVQSHTLQISKILAHPAPRAGELVRLDASPKGEGGDGTLEVIARFPGGLDFGKGLVDINFTMWPLFKCLNLDNILTICEIALSPTGRVLFFSRHPAMLGIAVNTIKYIVELRGWNGIALPAVHSRDAKIYIDDPGPWIMGLATEARYSVRPAAEVCVCDLDINYVSCPSPPPGVVSVKAQREKYRARLQTAFDAHYHPDHSVPSEIKEAFPAGRFRPICKIQAKRGASSTTVADQIKPPEWWHSTRIIQAFDAVLQDRYRKPSFLKRIGMFGSVKRQPQLSAAEQTIQLSIRKRATAFVDARDDLETKIGRLSRRLNFLMTESDLWRDKFVTFEQYAEKLSAEANGLRAKINKEQRETKRLSGLVTLTAVEKGKLQGQLRETEIAHQQAMEELLAMKEQMEKLELERSDMIADVEAQIERALMSMAVGMADSDYASSRASSRPGSRLSNFSTPRSRKTSDAGSKTRHLRSFGTESTLAESYSYEEDSMDGMKRRETETIEEDVEAEEAAVAKKRFSAIDADGMNAVDEGITEQSDKIAQKVLEIQEKLENALAADRRASMWRRQVSDASDDDADTEADAVVFPSTRSAAHSRNNSHASSIGKQRARSGTGSSSQTSRARDDFAPPRAPFGRSDVSSVGSSTPKRQSLTDFARDELTPEPAMVRKIASGASLGAMRAGTSMSHSNNQTDDSDTDFQSAYSRSPRDSFSSSDGEEEPAIDLTEVLEPPVHDELPDDFGKPLPTKNAARYKNRQRPISTRTDATLL
ncbi:hypothetical protein CYLTODRAFT_441142 [Cylindrobasidium torrendii FP15055 ss-10]|uniref:cDENN domain-containing protein n=1 Tax=Cylindrobasidium torrendii FP15055 ss-10 TaxID=1314674 RepID=A0A0D7BN71_9AGAR|nr:hypothetical protein CYLTODRAFT_441142 [Cylindrobasidium torrendii FP15055 ss-10]